MVQHTAASLPQPGGRQGLRQAHNADGGERIDAAELQVGEQLAIDPLQRLRR